MAKNYPRFIFVLFVIAACRTPLYAGQEPTLQEVSDIRALAEQGNAEAQFALGRMYAEGLGVAQDEADALAWYGRAAEQGHTDAQREVGPDYLGAIYGIAPPNAAITVVQAAPTPQDVAGVRARAERGDATAQYRLGKMYEVGRGVSGNLAEAVDWYRRAAEQGHVQALYETARRFGSGRNIEQDFGEERRLYRLAADQGHPRAQRQLALAYSRGDGVPRDSAQSEALYRSAAEGFRRAAEGGEGRAQYELGERYTRGEGVPDDAALAVAWYRRAAVSFRRAAEAGDAEAQYELGRLIDNTVLKMSLGFPNLWSGPVPPADDGRCAQCSLLDRWAFAWFMRAAEQGYADAQQAVAWAYASGEGVQRDAAEAVVWYRRAAEQEHVFSQASLARLYARGDGIPQDDAEAIRWYQRAADQHDGAAAAAIAELWAEGRGGPRDDLAELRREVADAFEEMSDVSRVQGIRIEEEWRGFGALSHTQSDYVLERASEGFEGSGNLSAASSSNGQEEARLDISIPVEAVEGFLRGLAESALEEGNYVPRRIMTDSYPSIRIELDLDTETLVFFSTSQGADATPWGVTLAGVTRVPAAYVINTAAPMDALVTLDPYLDTDARSALVDRVLGR